MVHEKHRSNRQGMVVGATALTLTMLVFSFGTACAPSSGDASEGALEDPVDGGMAIPKAGVDAPEEVRDASFPVDVLANRAHDGGQSSVPDATVADAKPLADANGESNAGALVTIQNIQPRSDVNGAVIDAHDGCLKQFANVFYLYGTAYGATDGFSTANRYRAYSSPDLVAWQPRGDLLSGAPAGVYYRPYVIYNAATHKYVLWYNWYATLWNGQLGVATSDSPQGPFTIVNDNVKVVNSGPGDESLFVDDDGIAYLIYTSIDKSHGMSIEKLSNDYLSSTMITSGILAMGVEAPALLKRGSTYYALFDSLCSFCGGGSGALVHTAQNPLGPYSAHNDINRNGSSIVVPAQQTFVAEIPTASGIAYIWMGDLWGSRPDGVKGHDLQYWSPPLVFDASGTIAVMTKVNSFTLRLP